MIRRTTVNLTEATDRQVEALSRKGFGSFTDIVRIAIDRMYIQEEKVSNKFFNISDRYGDAEEITLADYQAMNPEGEFKETWDGEIIQINSDEPGDWETVAVSDKTDRRLPKDLGSN